MRAQKCQFSKKRQNLLALSGSTSWDFISDWNLWRFFKLFTRKFSKFSTKQNGIAGYKRYRRYHSSTIQKVQTSLFNSKCKKKVKDNLTHTHSCLLGVLNRYLSHEGSQGATLVAQWLRCCAPEYEVWVQSPSYGGCLSDRGDKQKHQCLYYFGTHWRKPGGTN